MDYLETIIDDRDATAGTPEHNFITEHGLCIFFEKDRKKMDDLYRSFSPFLENSALSGVDITKVDHLILSHNHNDHTGGLEEFVKKQFKGTDSYL